MRAAALLFISLSCMSLGAQLKDKKLIWSDEFDQATLNSDYWTFELGDGCPYLCGWGNNERQIYTDTNHLLRDGNLVLQARLEDGEYTSTRIITKDKLEYTYGYFEVRAKLPVGQGIWPAFWMLGSNISELQWPLCGEIDVLEYVGREPGRNFYFPTHQSKPWKYHQYKEN